MRKLLLFHFLIMICVFVCMFLTAWMEGVVITLLKRYISGVTSNRFILTDW